jgi:hypothetical protein
MGGRVSAGRQFMVATIAAYSGYPPEPRGDRRTNTSVRVTSTGGVSRNGACVDPATLSVEGGGASTLQPTRDPVAPVIAPRRPR